MNPYFFVWWATVGAALVVKAAAWGIAGLILFAWCTGRAISSGTGW